MGKQKTLKQSREGDEGEGVETQTDTKHALNPVGFSYPKNILFFLPCTVFSNNIIVIIFSKQGQIKIAAHFYIL